MRHWVSVVLSLLLVVVSSNVRAQEAGDTVLLINGGRVRGTVLVDDPTGGIVSIRMADGKVRTLKRVEVRGVEYAAKTPAPVVVETTATPAPVGMNVVTQTFGQPPPPPVETTTLKPVWVAGAIITLSVWALRAAITFGVCGSYSKNQNGCDGQDYAGAAIPVIGAWVQAAQGIGGDHGATSAGVFGAIVGAGIAEAGGLAMFIIGLVVHREVRASATLGTVHVSPSLHPGGFGIVGSF